MAITFKMVGDKEFAKKIKDIASRCVDMSSIMKIVANKMRQDILKHFDDEQGSDSAWTDLKPMTWKWKLEHGYTNMLVNSGNLRKANLPISGKSWAGVYNNMSYAYTQNNGQGKVPAREFMWLSDDRMDYITKLISGYVVKGERNG